MRLTKQPDGSLLIECRGDQFTRDWKMALQTEKVLMSDGRPAVRRETALGTIFLTIHFLAWETLKKLPRNRPMVEHRTRLCEFCGAVLKVAREFEECWTFTCDRCKSHEIHSKLLIGGQIGAGEKELDQRRTR